LLGRDLGHLAADEGEGCALAGALGELERATVGGAKLWLIQPAV
jgi:hypothetical protein